MCDKFVPELNWEQHLASSNHNKEFRKKAPSNPNTTFLDQGIPDRLGKKQVTFVDDYDLEENYWAGSVAGAAIAQQRQERGGSYLDRSILKNNALRRKEGYHTAIPFDYTSQGSLVPSFQVSPQLQHGVLRQYPHPVLAHPHSHSSYPHTTSNLIESGRVGSQEKVETVEREAMEEARQKALQLISNLQGRTQAALPSPHTQDNRSHNQNYNHTPTRFHPHPPQAQIMHPVRYHPYSRPPSVPYAYPTYGYPGQTLHFPSPYPVQFPQFPQFPQFYGHK